MGSFDEPCLSVAVVFRLPGQKQKCPGEMGGNDVEARRTLGSCSGRAEIVQLAQQVRAVAVRMGRLEVLNDIIVIFMDLGDGQPRSVEPVTPHQPLSDRRPNRRPPPRYTTQYIHL